MTPDPVLLEVIRAALTAAAEEMSVTIWRTARSTVIRETLDYSTAVFDADGRLAAQSARLPVHLNSMGACLADLLAGPFPLADWCDGDVIVTNDPYAGAQHLPDIITFKPVFEAGERIGIVGTLCHHTDVGGGAAGSYDASARELFQEGLRLPPVKIIEGGRSNAALLAVMRANSREPDKLAGDFAAQLASLEMGAASLRRLARRYGVASFRGAVEAMMDQTERGMRAAIAAMPDGDYSFEDFVDDDGIEDRRLAIRIDLSIRGDGCTIDLSRSSPQAAGPVNCTLNMTRSAVYCALLCAAGGDVPANDGAYRAVRVIAAAGTVVNCRPPAPVANRMATGHRIVNAVLGAFARALPERIPAAYYGVSYVYTLATRDEDGRPQVYFEIEVGGWGAHPEADGADALSAGFHNLANSPMEMIESLYPVSFTRYALIPDSGGAGRHRGGLGLLREWRLEAEDGVVAANFDRFKVPPYGLAGGAPGRPGRFVLTRDSVEQELPSKIKSLAVRRGDLIRLETSGGGGHGDPATRSPEARAADLKGGYATR